MCTHVHAAHTCKRTQQDDTPNAAKTTEPPASPAHPPAGSAGVEVGDTHTHTHGAPRHGAGRLVPERRRGAWAPPACRHRGAGSPSPGWEPPPRSAGKGELSAREGGTPKPPPHHPGTPRGSRRCRIWPHPWYLCGTGGGDTHWGWLTFVAWGPPVCPICPPVPGPPCVSVPPPPKKTTGANTGNVKLALREREGSAGRTQPNWGGGFGGRGGLQLALGGPCGGAG